MIKRFDIRIAPVIGLSLAVLGMAIFLLGQSEIQAQGGDKQDAGKKGDAEKILKLAAAIKAGNKEEIKTLTAALAKRDHEDVMIFLKPRSRGGLGMGREPGKFAHDGIELKLQVLGRDAPSAAALAKESAGIEEAAYILAAIGEVMAAKGPPAGKKGDKKDWTMWSQEMKDNGLALAQSLKKAGADVKAAATKVNTNCAVCHSVFRPL